MNSTSPAHGLERPAILVVEHDPLVGTSLVEQLLADGYAARLALSLEHARTLARTLPPQLVILGELEPSGSALELLAEIRAGARSQARCPERPSVCRGWVAELPVIVLGTSTQEVNLLRAFEAGADDFLARPAPYLELRARIRAILVRSTHTYGSTLVQVGALTIDTSTRAVSVHGHRVALRRLEYELLLALAREPERVFARRELMLLIWSDHLPLSSRTLDTHASRLRNALGTSGSERWILNVRGVGYRLS
jgi:DNA-binding response OmpR family regulator